MKLTVVKTSPERGGPGLAAAGATAGIRERAASASPIVCARRGTPSRDELPARRRVRMSSCRGRTCRFHTNPESCEGPRPWGCRDWPWGNALANSANPQPVCCEVEPCTCAGARSTKNTAGSRPRARSDRPCLVLHPALGASEEIRTPDGQHGRIFGPGRNSPACRRVKVTLQKADGTGGRDSLGKSQRGRPGVREVAARRGGREPFQTVAPTRFNRPADHRWLRDRFPRASREALPDWSAAKKIDVIGGGDWKLPE